MNGKVILFTNARDELKLKEWVAHHLLLGFDFIYIFDHKSKIPLKGQFLDFNKDKFQVYVQRCELDGAIKRTLISTAANIAKKHKFEWMLYLDADEFLVINNDYITNVKKLLSYYSYAHSISCNWFLFGTNFHVKEPNGLIIDNYTRSEPTLNEHLKSFIRPSEFVSPDPHRSTIKNPNKAYHVNGKQLKDTKDINNCFYQNPINFKKAQVFIAHYIIQSQETYSKRKLNNPRDDTGTFRDKNMESLHSLHNNIINTLVTKRYSEKIKKYLENIK